MPEEFSSTVMDPDLENFDSIGIGWNKPDYFAGIKEIYKRRLNFDDCIFIYWIFILRYFLLFVYLYFCMKLWAFGV